MKIRNILWDTDGGREALASLPKEVELPSRFDTISNWLSDEFGFCHLGFDVGDDDI